jgi:hypothetical protein
MPVGLIRLLGRQCTSSAKKPAPKGIGEGPVPLREKAQAHAVEKWMTTGWQFPKMKRPDNGTILMNVGAIAGLTGFAMSDVMYLRSLSVFGSFCGIAYNLTRTPSQINACLWSGLFISVNGYQIYKLVQERSAANPERFTTEEMNLFKNHYEEHNVDPVQFYRLLSKATWKKCIPEEVLVKQGDKLNKVIMINDGKARAMQSISDDEREVFLWHYEGGRRGCIIGGTALLDPSVRSNSYPQTVVTSKETSYLEW